MAMGGGVFGIEPAVVIGARLIDGLLQIFGQGLAGGFVFFDFHGKEGLHGGIAFHDADAGGGPTEREVGIEALAGHSVVAGAAGVIDGEDDLGDGGGGHGLDHLGAGADDAFALDFDAHHETGDVLEVDQRQAEALGGFDEVSDFSGGFGIDDAANARAAFGAQEAAA